MESFEFDSNKSSSNLQRHGVDFKQAQELWNAPYVIIPAKNIVGENRSIILGKIKEKIYAAVFTARKKNIRIISCHRADSKLEKIYRRSLYEKTF